MFEFLATQRFIKSLEKLDSSRGEEVKQKLRFLAKQGNPLWFAKKIKGYKSIFRFRSGDIRCGGCGVAVGKLRVEFCCCRVYNFCMLKARYKNMIKKVLVKHLPKDAKVFIFGSSLSSDNFADIDVGIKAGRLNRLELSEAEEELEEAYIPYKVDLIDFNKVDKKFENAVFKNKVSWLI